MGIERKQRRSITVGEKYHDQGVCARAERGSLGRCGGAGCVPGPGHFSPWCQCWQVARFAPLQRRWQTGEEKIAMIRMFSNTREQMFGFQHIFVVGRSSGRGEDSEMSSRVDGDFARVAKRLGSRVLRAATGLVEAQERVAGLG